MGSGRLRQRALLFSKSASVSPRVRLMAEKIINLYIITDSEEEAFILGLILSKNIPPLQYSVQGR